MVPGFAARAGFVVASYRDEAEGTLAAEPDGKQAMTRVVLRPTDRLDGPRADARSWPTCTTRAHEECFIANSVKSEVVIEP